MRQVTHRCLPCQPSEPVPRQRSPHVPSLTSALIWALVPLAWPRVTFLSAPSVCAIHPALPAAGMVRPTGRSTEGEFALMGRLRARRTCSCEPLLRTQGSTCGPHLPPAPLLCSLVLLSETRHSIPPLAFMSLAELFLLPQCTFICQPETPASRARVLLQSCLNVQTTSGILKTHSITWEPSLGFAHSRHCPVGLKALQGQDSPRFFFTFSKCSKC